MCSAFEVVRQMPSPSLKQSSGEGEKSTSGDKGLVLETLLMEDCYVSSNGLDDLYSKQTESFLGK